MEEVLKEDLVGNYDNLMASANGKKLTCRIIVDELGNHRHAFVVKIDEGELLLINSSLTLALDEFNKG